MFPRKETFNITVRDNEKRYYTLILAECPRNQENCNVAVVTQQLHYNFETFIIRKRLMLILDMRTDTTHCSQSEVHGRKELIIRVARAAPLINNDSLL